MILQNRMKKQKASSRIKRRHLLIVAESKEEVEKAILEYIGILGWAKASPIFVSSKGKDIVLSINREEVVNVRAALSLSKNIKVKRVSGTLKGLDNK